MLGKLIDALVGRKTLIDEARHETVLMLVKSREMFDLVVVALKDETGKHIRSKILAMDKEVNRQMGDIRRKVFEHLTISRGKDLLQGLELVTVVIDVERIGDYSKNISELIEMMPEQLDFGDYEEVYQQAEDLVCDLFDLGVPAFLNRDQAGAQKVMDKYDKLSKLCDGTLGQLMNQKGNRDMLEKRLVGLILMLRYLKRVGAHIKNIASALINPFPRIGFRPQS